MTSSCQNNLSLMQRKHQESQGKPWLFCFSWEQRKLGEVASSFEYGLNAAAKEFDGVNKYLRITDIDDSSRAFKDDDLTSPDTDLSTASNYLLHDGEILFARTGASVGKSFIYRESDGLVYFAGFLIRAKIKPEYDPEFVFRIPSVFPMRSIFRSLRRDPASRELMLRSMANILF